MISGRIIYNGSHSLRPTPRGRKAFTLRKSTMSKSDQHVVPYEDGWAVKRENSARPTSVHQSKGEAIDVGSSIAQQEGVELIVHGAGGQPLRSPGVSALDEKMIRAWSRAPGASASWGGSSTGGTSRPSGAAGKKKSAAKKSAVKKSSAKKSTAKKALTKGHAAGKKATPKSVSRGSAARKSGAKKSATKKAGRK